MVLIGGWLVLAAAIAVATAIMPGLEVDWWPGLYLAFAAVYAAVNLILGTVVRLISLPLLVLTLGLFSVVINGGLLLVTDWLFDSFKIDGFFTAIVAALVISVLSFLIGLTSLNLGTRGRNAREPAVPKPSM